MACSYVFSLENLINRVLCRIPGRGENQKNKRKIRRDFVRVWGVGDKGSYLFPVFRFDVSFHIRITFFQSRVKG